jgi:hypothetical protein
VVTVAVNGCAGLIPVVATWSVCTAGLAPPAAPVNVTDDGVEVNGEFEAAPTLSVTGTVRLPKLVNTVTVPL